MGLTSQPMNASDPTLSDKRYAYERLGEGFAQALSVYDTERRLDVLIDVFLSDVALRGLDVLDVGCGLGFFSERLTRRGALVTATDLGPSLVDRACARAGCAGEVVDALHLVDRFGPGRFDGVVSSECIEHTPDPAEALRQMARVLKPGGFLAVSTPNLLWQPVVRAASAIGARPFDGYENFTSWQAMRRVLRESNVTVVRERGLHLFPFQIPLHRLSMWCDRRLQFLRPFMINICVLGRKQDAR